jgi:hypothetical protein
LIGNPDLHIGGGTGRQSGTEQADGKKKRAIHNG